MPADYNESMHALGAQGSAIRELFAYGQARKAEIGADKVFDFSLGNPSIPAPPEVRQAIVEALDEPSLELHGYTPAAGLVSTRAAVASTLNARHGTSYSASDLYLTMGAAAALDAAFNAVCVPGDEVVVIAPFFPEYRMWIEAAGCACVVSPAREADLQIDAGDVASRITERTRAVVVNSPNNPSGTVYSRENLAELAGVLREAEERLGRRIYLVADEPYREIAYAGVEVPWIPDIYGDTIVCYSYSKSLSMPGERIGWVLVPPEMPGAKDVYAAIAGAGRALGYVCAPSLIQRVLEKCCALPTDVAAYAANRDALTRGLGRIGYEYVEPRGAFYLWVKALEPDAKAFSARARDNHELLLVPSDDFGQKGYVRIAYCVDKKVIEGSMPAFEALYREYRG